MRPGLWEVTSEVVSVAEERLPIEIAERMKGPRPTVRHCITPAQAARPQANFIAARRSGRCTDERFEMSGGRISGAMRCREEGGGETRLRMSGRYGAERYETSTDVETPGIGRGRTMRLVMRQSGRRVGECPAAGGAG